ncbi:MAG: hypothetical protein Q9203_002969 [Teloschistes exilis]
MSRYLNTTFAFALTATSLFAAFKSYVAIVSLQKYEERSERAAKLSETAAHELHKTRVTQGSSAGAIALSYLSSVAVTLRSLFGTPTTPTWELILALTNVVAVAAAFVHNKNYWKAKAKVPFVGGFNEGIEKSKEVRQLLVFLGILWGSWEFQAIITWISG